MLLGLKTFHFDVKTAFLIPELPEKQHVFMRLFTGVSSMYTIVQLFKSLYGLKQAPRLWAHEFMAFLRELGFVALPEAPCVFILREKGQIKAILGLFVDDSILAADQQTKDFIFAKLSEKYSMKDLGTPDFMLGIRVEYSPIGDKLFLSQEAYVLKMLEKFEVEEREVATPESGHTLGPNDFATTPEEVKEMETVPYREGVGFLFFLAICTP